MLAIIILNYNTWKESISCMQSIETSLKGIDYHIYLVDNCSTIAMQEEERTYIYDKINIDLLLAKQNRGYAAGNNLGIKAAFEDHCDHFLICNSDILFDDDSINKLIHFLHTEETYGIVAPMIFNEVDILQPIYMLSKLTLLGKYKNLLISTPFRFLVKNFTTSFIYCKDYLNKLLDVFSVSGCCFLVSEACMHDIFPFDEATFLYEEELIIGIRLEAIHKKAAVLPDTHVKHLQGVSTAHMKAFSYSCFVHSEVYYCFHYLKKHRIQVLPLTLIRTLKYVLLSCRSDDYRNYFKTYMKNTVLLFLKKEKAQYKDKPRTY